jgi:chitinase
MKKILVFVLVLVAAASHAQKQLDIIAYYSGDATGVEKLPAEKLTHIIYSFCHLKANRLSVDNASDSLTIRKLVELKKRNKDLKIILSLGGWGGCETCSDVFSSQRGRKEFAASVLELNKSFATDGIDLDWEYPAIEGYPGHKYGPADLHNFTALVQQLRKTLGRKYEISFAAGGFEKFLNESAEWKPVMDVVDRVNLMSYDLVNGFSTTTGHHTPLYSTTSQKESTDNAVKILIDKGVPREKIVIGAAFYARIWKDVPAMNNGLYQSGVFESFTDYRAFPSALTKELGYEFFWDETAKAPYAFNKSTNRFATFDNTRSLELKTKYAIEQKLGGIMFWEIVHDLNDELVNTIYNVKATVHQLKQ